MNDIKKTKKELIKELELERENCKTLEKQVEQQIRNSEKLLKEKEDEYSILYTEGQTWCDLARDYATRLKKINNLVAIPARDISFILGKIKGLTTISTPFDEEITNELNKDLES